MVISQGDIWWADLAEPMGSQAGYRRPVVVVQCDAFNQSRIGTVVCVPLTSNLKWAAAPGNVAVSAKASGLTKNSVANVSLIVSIDRTQLTKRVGKLSKRNVDAVLSGIDIVLGR